MLNKTYLVSYKSNRVQPLNSGCWHFTMFLKKVWFWGLFTTKDTTQYLIPEYHCFKTTTDHWDKLIEDKAVIK